MTFHIKLVSLGASVKQNKVCVCVSIWLSNAAVNLLLYNWRARAEKRGEDRREVLSHFHFDLYLPACLSLFSLMAPHTLWEAPEGLLIPGTVSELFPRRPCSLPGYDSQSTPPPHLLLPSPPRVLHSPIIPHSSCIFPSSTSLTSPSSPVSNPLLSPRTATLSLSSSPPFLILVSLLSPSSS